MRRAHSWRRSVRLLRRWATSSRRRSSRASWWPFVTALGSVGSAIGLLGLGGGAEGQNRHVVAEPAFRGGDDGRLHARGHRVWRQPSAGFQQGQELPVAEDLLAPA